MTTQLKTVKQSKDGIDYVDGLLREKKHVITKAIFWKIPHTNSNDELSLKIGRYNKGTIFRRETLEYENPKSELTLDSEELSNLIMFLEENYKPLMLGAGRYIKADDNLDEALATKIADVFQGKDSKRIAKFITDNNLLSSNVANLIEYNRRSDAIAEFKQKLQKNETEYNWQTWFTENDWVLGNEFAEILDERAIDVNNVADYLMKTFDGFVDLVEIKRPDGNLKFWDMNRDHNNFVPHPDLIKAVTQVQNYIHQLEKQIDSIDMRTRLNNIPTVKPRATLIFGRSNDWEEDKRCAFRLLCAGYNNLTILTYDHVLSRAERSMEAKGNDNSRQI